MGASSRVPPSLWTEHFFNLITGYFSNKNSPEMRPGEFKIVHVNSVLKNFTIYCPDD